MQSKPYPNQVLLKLHAIALTQKIEMKHPTTTFVAALKRDPKAFPEHREHLLKAFASNLDFDLARSNIDVVVRAMNPSGSSNSSSENVTRATRCINHRRTYNEKTSREECTETKTCRDAEDE